MSTDADLDMILADMRQEFLEGCEDRLDEVDQAIKRLYAGEGNRDNQLLDIKRHVHSIKGLGGSFGFMSVSMIAHALEDFMETARDIGKNELYDIQLHVDKIRDILESGDSPSEDETAAIIRRLPLKTREGRRTSLKREVTVLLLMEKGLQRKIIGRELKQFGFNVVIAEEPLEAIDKAISYAPELIMASAHSPRLSGLELAGVFKAIEATKDHHFMLMTASDDDSLAGIEIPDHVTVVKKGITFARDLMMVVKEMGLI